MANRTVKSESRPHSKRKSPWPLKAQIAANRINAQASTGPRTPEGKARTSQNAVSSGLFSKRDFVRPEETALYTEVRDTLWADLHPATMMEKIQTAEIVTATWRLRRCGLLEEALESAPDPEKEQKSIDRARIQAHGLILRATAELRRLRKDRLAEIQPKVPPTEPTQSRPDLTRLTSEEIEAILATTPCPCNSGQIYVNCCATNAVTEKHTAPLPDLTKAA
jgi:hypothetical protein